MSAVICHQTHFVLLLLMPIILAISIQTEGGRSESASLSSISSPKQRWGNSHLGKEIRFRHLQQRPNVFQSEDRSLAISVGKEKGDDAVSMWKTMPSRQTPWLGKRISISNDELKTQIKSPHNSWSTLFSERNWSNRTNSGSRLQEEEYRRSSDIANDYYLPSSLYYDLPKSIYQKPNYVDHGPIYAHSHKEANSHAITFPAINSAEECLHLNILAPAIGIGSLIVIAVYFYLHGNEMTQSRIINSGEVFNSQKLNGELWDKLVDMKSYIGDHNTKQFFRSQEKYENFGKPVQDTGRQFGNRCLDMMLPQVIGFASIAAIMVYILMLTSKSSNGEPRNLDDLYATLMFDINSSY